MKDAFDTLSDQQEEAGKAVQANTPGRLPKNLKCPVCREPLYAEVQPKRNLWKCVEGCFTFSEPWLDR